MSSLNKNGSHEDTHPIEYHVEKNADGQRPIVPPLPLLVDCTANRVHVIYRSSTGVAMGWGRGWLLIGVDFLMRPKVCIILEVEG